jgi:hypothetical protein
VVVLPFLDSYYNLSVKTAALIRWPEKEVRGWEGGREGGREEGREGRRGGGREGRWLHMRNQTDGSRA